MYEFWAGVEGWSGFTTFNESLFAYPAVQGIHVLALGVAVGLLAIADLRLAGYVLTRHTAQAVLGSLRPWFIGGFGVVFCTGLLLFLSQATRFYDKPLFLAKLALIALAGINAVWFEVVVRGESRNGFWSAKTAALSSLGLWTLIIIFGRLLAYF